MAMMTTVQPAGRCRDLLCLQNRGIRRIALRSWATGSSVRFVVGLPCARRLAFFVISGPWSAEQPQLRCRRPGPGPLLQCTTLTGIGRRTSPSSTSGCSSCRSSMAAGLSGMRTGTRLLSARYARQLGLCMSTSRGRSLIGNLCLRAAPDRVPHPTGALLRRPNGSSRIPRSAGLASMLGCSTASILLALAAASTSTASQGPAPSLTWPRSPAAPSPRSHHGVRR